MRSGEDHVVERVVELGAEVEAIAFGETQPLLDEDVEVLVTGNANIRKVAAYIPERELRSAAEGGRA